jgi:NAD+ diphosphatase
MTFLGMIDTQPVFAMDLTFHDEKKNEYADRVLESALSNVIKDPARFENTRTVAPLLDPNTNDNELVIYATALVQWQRRAPHCMRCGSETILVEGGTSRKCSSCGDRSWPRQDPSMIVAVSSRDGKKILLGRSKRHPTGAHSTLAGFVEAGESMERAVAREVYEEVGIRVDEDTLRYVASQPWPFPQSTMMGFICTADENQPLNIDENELAGAAWFDKSQVLLASTIYGPVMQKDVAEAAFASNPDLSLLVPPKGVVARTLIDRWLSSN